MKTVNIHEAKTHLSRLIEDVARGNTFIIAKSGKPMAKVMPLSAKEGLKAKRLGFMAGEIMVPDDFDAMASTQLAALFEGIDP